MKPANFPGRKNERRKAALARLGKIPPPYSRVSSEAAVLKSRILPDNVARSIRTKKDRSSRAKVRA